MATRNTAKYHLKRPGGKIAHRGITERPLEQRWREHQDKYPGTYIMQVGPRVSRESGLRWERDGGKRL